MSPSPSRGGPGRGPWNQKWKIEFAVIGFEFSIIPIGDTLSGEKKPCYLKNERSER
jgi:hypothetical protein